MSHLSPSEFVDLAEGALDPRRAAHAETCAACRAQAAVVENALRMTVESNDVPEPSPLFWNQLSARVREGVAQTERHWWSGLGFGIGGIQPVVAGLALAVVAFTAVLLTRDAFRAAPAPQLASVSSPVPADGYREPDPALDAHAEVWAVLTAVAGDLQLDDAHEAGMAVPSAAVDRAVQSLTDDERAELGRLLQSELKRSSN